MEGAREQDPDGTGHPGQGPQAPPPQRPAPPLDLDQHPMQEEIQGGPSVARSHRHGDGDLVQQARDEKDRTLRPAAPEEAFQGALHHAHHHLRVAEVPSPGPEIGQAGGGQGIAEEGAHRHPSGPPPRGQHSQGPEVESHAHGHEDGQHGGPSQVAHPEGQHRARHHAGQADAEVALPLDLFRGPGKGSGVHAEPGESEPQVACPPQAARSPPAPLHIHDGLQAPEQGAAQNHHSQDGIRSHEMPLEPRQGGQHHEPGPRTPPGQGQAPPPRPGQHQGHHQDRSQDHGAPPRL